MSQTEVQLIKNDAVKTADIADDQVTIAKLNATGTASSSTFLRGDGSFAVAGAGKTHNLVINGAMEIAQRGTSSTTAGINTVDRFRADWTGVDNPPTQAQVDVTAGTTPYTEGFRKAFKITNGDQTSGADAGDYIGIDTSLEAQDIAKSGWNYLSSSSNITLSFWIKSSVAQNFYGYLFTSDGTQQNYPFETGSLTADTWTKVTKTIPGNSNLQFDNDNGAGLQIQLWAYLGTSYTGTLTLNQWAAFAGATRTPNNTATWYTTNVATLEITGVQLEVGSNATDFEHKSLDQDYHECLRYAYVINVADVDAIDRSYGYAYSATIVRGLFYLPRAMRTYPSYTGTATDVNFYAANNSAYFHLDDIVTYLGSTPTSPFPNTFAWGTTSSSMTAGNAGILLGREDNGKITFDAER